MVRSRLPKQPLTPYLEVSPRGNLPSTWLTYPRRVDIDWRESGTRMTASESTGGADLAFGRFELVRELGAGGTATVWEALDWVAGERVALKILRPELTRSTVDRQAFLAEARFVAGVQHPGVVRIVDRGEQERPGLPPQAWVAMELIEGRTLARDVRESGPLSVADALVLTESLLDALDAVHRSGIVHRDVTPANVMLSAAPGQPLGPAQVRLFDFGLAGPPGSPASASLAAGAGVPAFIWGSAPYLSPEHASGSPVYPGADLYQAGGVLYFALTGQAPFERENAEALMLAHVNDPVDPPSLHRPDLPERVDRLVLRALSKSPMKRFASAQEMRWAVRETRIALLENEVVTARLVPVPLPAQGVDQGLGQERGRALRPWPGPGPHAPASAGAWGGGTGGRQASRASRPGSRILLLGGAAVVMMALVVGGIVAMIGGRDAPRVEAISSEPPKQAAVVVEPEPTVTAPRLVAVPDLVGRTLSEARGLLEAAGLKVGEITTSNSSAAAETVLSLANPAGVRVAPGTPISITIASGWNAVPNLGGLTEAEAQSALAAAGFSGVAARSGQGTPGNQGTPSTPAPPGSAGPALVSSSQPVAGTVVRLGTQVTFALVSQATAPTAPTEPIPTPADPSDPTGPTDPVDPAGPTDPTNPTSPTDPTGQTAP